MRGARPGRLHTICLDALWSPEELITESSCWLLGAPSWPLLQRSQGSKFLHFFFYKSIWKARIDTSGVRGPSEA